MNPERKIVGIGYNGMPNGCSDDELPWTRKATDRLDTKYPYGRLVGTLFLLVSHHNLFHLNGRQMSLISFVDENWLVPVIIKEVAISTILTVEFLIIRTK